MARMFTVSATPHVRDKTNIPTIMYSVIAALMPAFAGAVYFFGYRALMIIALSVVTCVVTEAVIQRLSGRSLTVTDGSAIVTGLLLAFNLPAGVSWWIPVVGSFFAIAVGKLTFGGLGYNPLNPALLGRAFLQISWPVEITATWIQPRGALSVDAETVATPLGILKENIAILKSTGGESIETVNAAVTHIVNLKSSYMDMFIGRVPGCLGETSALLLLIGAVFLLYKRYIDWRIPGAFIGTVAVLTWIFGGYDGLFTGPWLFHILAGGVMIGALFMATDMVTSPITPSGQLLFGFGCGLLTVIIRLVGGYPEGVSFSILLMNLTVPLIDRYTRPKVFGAGGNVRDVLKFGFILMIYSLIAGSALAFVNLKSKPRIDENMRVAEESARTRVLPDMKGGFESVDSRDFHYWIGYRDEARTLIGGYVFIARGKGYSSTIESMVGVDSSGIITGADVLFQQETPGLGARVKEVLHGDSGPWFMRQFVGMQSEDVFAVTKDEGNIDTITGATISSRAVAGSIGNGLVHLKENLGGFR